MKHLKLSILLILALTVILFSFAACDAEGNGTETDPVTEAPTETPTDGETTEAPTEAPTAPAESDTLPAKGGCGSMVLSLSAVLTVAAAAIALKKKED